jgi:hypothetical protein
MTNGTTCKECNSDKRLRECVYCRQLICKNCTHFSEESDYNLYLKIPSSVKTGSCCEECFLQNIKPELENYQSLVLQAKDVFFITKNYRGNVRIFAKHTKRVLSLECSDRREAILKLALQAAQLKFNAIIEGEIEDKKVKSAGGYQSTRWFASALPANIDGDHLELASLRGL